MLVSFCVLKFSDVLLQTMQRYVLACQPIISAMQRYAMVVDFGSKQLCFVEMPISFVVVEIKLVCIDAQIGTPSFVLRVYICYSHSKFF